MSRGRNPASVLPRAPWDLGAFVTGHRKGGTDLVRTGDAHLTVMPISPQCLIIY